MSYLIYFEILTVFLTIALAMNTSKYFFPGFINNIIPPKLIFFSYSIFLIFYFVYKYHHLFVSDVGFLYVSILSVLSDFIRLCIYKFKRKIINIIRDLTFNFLYFCQIYLIATYNKLNYIEVFLIIVALIAGLSRVVKFRIADKDAVLEDEILIENPNWWQRHIIFTQPVGDYAVRSVIHTVLPFSLAMISFFFSGDGPFPRETYYFNIPQGNTDSIIVNSIYFIVTVGHTVGFGDITPTVGVSKLFYAIVLFFYAILFGVIISNIFNTYKYIFKYYGNKE